MTTQEYYLTTIITYYYHSFSGDRVKSSLSIPAAPTTTSRPPTPVSLMAKPGTRVTQAKLTCGVQFSSPRSTLLTCTFADFRERRPIANVGWGRLKRWDSKDTGYDVEEGGHTRRKRKDDTVSTKEKEKKKQETLKMEMGNSKHKGNWRKGETESPRRKMERQRRAASMKGMSARNTGKWLAWV